MVRRVGVGTRHRRTLAPKAACAATAPARLDLACPRQRATSAAHPAKPACGDIPAAAEPLPVDRVLEATLPDGTAWALDACLVVRMRDGLITRLDEYLDSAKADVLTAGARRGSGAA